MQTSLVICKILQEDPQIQKENPRYVIVDIKEEVCYLLTESQVIIEENPQDKGDTTKETLKAL